jgi:Fic family protein
MCSFSDTNKTLAAQPPRIGTLLRGINTGYGREQLFREQVPQLLQSLAEATRVASIQASTAIEGYDVSDQRAEHLARGNGGRFRNRNEKEFAGYRDAIDAIVRDGNLAPITAAYPFYLTAQLHRYTTGEPGRPKEGENQIVSYESGVKRVIFKPVAPHLVESTLRSLLAGYNEALNESVADPVLLLGLFVLDFLATHPIADGNGRISRLLTAHELMRMGYGVVRYVSVEQLIFDSKNSYYDALEASQRGWHDGEHDVWPWLTYFVTILADAYEKFETKVAGARSAHGSKAERAREWALHEAPPEFRFAEAVTALPGISSATIRVALNGVRDEGRFEATLGASAVWRRVGSPEKGRALHR